MKKIILTNQHVDNRGDESATIGAIKSLRNFFGQDTEISIYLQSGIKYKFLPDYCMVNEKPMIIGAFGILEMFIWIIFKLIKIDIQCVCSYQFKAFIADHESSDIVISSCGGPYIGDIYINHEFIHIMHLAVPLLLHKKITFFAPSMGPFHNKFMNYFRKKILKRADLIILRDEISYKYVQTFLNKNKGIYLTADACLADELKLDKINKTPNTIGITPLDYIYPQSNNKSEMKSDYVKIIVYVLDKLMEQNTELRVEFFPQLFAKHTDLPFINKIINKMKYPERTFIFSDRKSGREQQIEISALDYMIANRYHSAIFACKTYTPVVCIVYEHKAKAFMESVNLGDYCLNIYDLNARDLLERINSLEINSSEIRSKLPSKMQELHNVANRTAELIYNFATKNQL